MLFEVKTIFCFANGNGRVVAQLYVAVCQYLMYVFIISLYMCTASSIGVMKLLQQNLSKMLATHCSFNILSRWLTEKFNFLFQTLTKCCSLNSIIVIIRAMLVIVLL
jgi:hypothetical protein